MTPSAVTGWRLRLRDSRRLRVIGGSLLLGAVAIQIASLALRTDTAYSPFFDVFVAGMPMVLCVLACFLRAAVTEKRRSGALWIGTATLSFTAATLIYITWTQFQPDPTAPRPTGLLFLLVYPCMAIGMIRLIRRDGAGSAKPRWMDGALGAAGGATALAAILNSLLAGVEGNSTVILVAGDLLLVAVACGILATRGLHAGPMWRWLVIGLALFSAGDFTYSWRSLTGTYEFGSLLDALWPVALATMAFALWQSDPRPQDHDPGRSSAVLTIPLLATATAVIVLVLAAVIDLSYTAVGLATFTLLLAAVRMRLSFRHIQRLTDALERAITDDLTGLGNRRALFEMGDDRLRSAAPQERLGLLLIDLDDFREINDALGHLAGDDVLREVASRLSADAADGDLVARVGGDEFAVLFTIDPAADGTAVASAMLGALANPTGDSGREGVAASAGFAERCDEAQTIDELLRRADVALCAAQDLSTTFGQYRPELDEVARARLQIIHDLEQAFRDDEFVLHFQPKINLATGDPSGAEVLIRWQHPTRGLLFPDAFLEVIEQTRQMGALTRYVLDAAIRQVATWRDELGLEVPIAVNLSATDLLDEGLADHVCDVLRRSDVPSRLLELEVTESELMTDRRQATSVLNQLSALGIKISVDDYGTGYCSLAYLRDLPVDILKIDRSFVDHDPADHRSAAIVRSTIELAHALGMQVVAEGVEQDHTRLALIEMGCDFAQGYFFSRPVSADRYVAWNAEHMAATPERAAAG